MGWDNSVMSERLAFASVALPAEAKSLKWKKEQTSDFHALTIFIAYWTQPLQQSSKAQHVFLREISDFSK